MQNNIPTAVSQLSNDSSFIASGANISSLSNDSGFVIPSGVATAVNNNTTTISGAKITTGTLAANRLEANSTLTNLLYVGNALILNTSGKIYTAGKTSWSDSTAGIFIGYENSFGTAGYKLKIGNSSQFISWNGSNLAISGSVSITNASSVRTTLNVADGATANPNAIDPADVASHIGGENTTTINGGIINTGTINASSIKIDNVTLDTDGSGNLIIKGGGVDTAQVANDAITEHTMDHFSDLEVSKNTTSYQTLGTSQSISGHAATMVTKATVSAIALDNNTYGTGDGINFNVKVEELRNGSIINNTTYTDFAVRDANVSTVILPLITTISSGFTYTYRISGKVNSSYGSAEEVKWLRPTVETTMLKR